MQTAGRRGEYTVAPASQLVTLAEHVSYEAAPALDVASTTTWRGMNERARTMAQDTVLVMGGGCGVAAVQIGKLIGARVLAATGPEWTQMRLREVGADAVFSYHDSDCDQQVRAATGARGVIGGLRQCRHADASEEHRLPGPQRATVLLGRDDRE